MTRLNPFGRPVDGSSVTGAKWFDQDVRVGQLARPRAPIPAATRCDAVEAMFRADAELTSVVVGIGRRVRLINRVSFYQALVGPKGYGWALYRTRPVAALRLESEEPVVLDAGTAVVAAGLDLLGRGASPADDVLVRWPDGTIGTVPAAELFAGLAEHERAQARILADNERRFRALVEHLSDAIAVLDEAGQTVYASPSPVTAPGERADVMAATHPDDSPALRALIGRTLAAPETPFSGEFRLRVDEGTYRMFELVTRNLLADPAVGGIVVNYRDVTRQRELEGRLRHQALHDPLTGLPNRTLLLDRIGLALESGLTACLLYLDLDGFKSINDSLGHTVGDSLLERVGTRLRSCVRPGDTLARLGGDEFAVLIESGPVAADDLAARLHASLAEPLPLGDRNVHVEVSIGYAVVDDPSIGADELLRRADHAMYAAKAQGKNRTVGWSAPLQAALSDDDRLSSDLDGAAERGELFVVYQPIVDMNTRRVRGVEALARWQHPERGLVGPDRFIPLAERTGQISEIGRWVLETACRQVAAWHADGRPLRLSVNVSGGQMRAELAPAVASILESTGLPASALELEVTETALISNLSGARRTLDELKRLGVSVAIDDFGTGYSSLSYLRELPVDTLKIDKSFIDNLGRSQQDSQLVDGVIRLAHSIGLSVTAEGIEHSAQETALRRMGCDEAQGYFYARPLDAAAVAHHGVPASARFRTGESRTGESPTGESRTGESGSGEPRTGKFRTGEDPVPVGL